MNEQYSLLEPHAHPGVADTSREAHDKIKPVMSVMQEKVFHYIEAYGRHGATNAEIAAGVIVNWATHETMQERTVCGRANELWEMGRIRSTFTRKNAKGRSCKVWVAV